MWKRLDTLPYYILLTQSKNINISLTDYVEIWTVRFTVDELASCLQNCNPLLNIDSNELVTNGLEMVNQIETLKSTISKVNEDLQISLRKSFGYPLKLKIVLKLGSHQDFFLNVTQSLLLTIKDLHNSENELRLLLKHKDKEIEEYKTEAGEICLRYLKTKPYNDEQHMEKHTCYNKHFGATGIPESLIVKYVDMPEEKNKNQDISKTEHQSESSICVKTEIVEATQENIKIEPCISASNTITKKRKLKLKI